MQRGISYLLPEDKKIMQEAADQYIFSANEIIIKQGDAAQGIYIMNEGTIIVEQDGMILARLGPGEIFGEMSYIEGKPVSATIVSESESKIALISVPKANELLTTYPDLASRFFKTLVVNLSSRLRNTSKRLAQIRLGRGEDAPSSKLAKVNMMTKNQIPIELVNTLSEIKLALEKTTLKLQEHKINIDKAYDDVEIVLNRAVEIVKEYTNEENIFEASYSDLLAFRNEEELEIGIGALIFRELFSTLTLSNTMARLYARPRGVPEDYEAGNSIRENVPTGDGQLGGLVDKWFLNRPICHGRRAEASFVKKYLTNQKQITQFRFNICDLASGTASTTSAILNQFPNGNAICIDRDSQSLQYVLAEENDLKLMDRIKAICVDISELWSESSEIYLETQDIFLALGLFEYLNDQEVVDLLRLCTKKMNPGGALLFTTILPSHPDLILMSHLLEWRVKPRNHQQLKKLFSKAGVSIKDKLIIIDDDNFISYGIYVS